MHCPQEMQFSEISNPLKFILPFPIVYDMRKIGFTPKLKYSISASFITKMTPIYLFSPEYKFDR